MTMPIEITSRLLAALLAILPRVPQPQRGRIERQHDRIVEMATASAEAYEVPVGILLVTAFLETHLGVDNGEGGGWGAPINRAHRHTAGTSDHAARALARSHEVCHDWFHAITRFRSGQCVFRRRLIGYEPDYAARLVTRMYEQAGLPAPDGLDR
jgi:hypothetical protein